MIDAHFLNTQKENEATEVGLAVFLKNPLIDYIHN